MTLTTSVRPRRLRAAPSRDHESLRPRGLVLVFAAEVLASVLGFAALVHQARALGPESFARLEYAGVVVAWLLVVVRGGVDVIVYREAARRPRLISPLTDRLLGLRCLAALIAYLAALAIASLVGPERGRVVTVSALALFASAWSADVLPRATGRLGWVALGQVVRASGFLTAVVMLVRGPNDAVRAASCLVIGEGLGALILLIQHGLTLGFPYPTLRGRASLVLARRGAVAGLTRFLRVTLYGMDLLALGWWSGGDLGAYAASRRLVFALVALGIVVPAALGPSVARAWSLGDGVARARIGAILRGTWALSLPAAVGLGLTADRWMPAIFGAAYREGGPLLAVVAARLPWLLVASFAQSALVACRREDRALGLVVGQLGLALLLVPASVVLAGPVGVGWAALIVEAAGAIAGCWLLSRLGVATSWSSQTGQALVGCLGLVACWRLTRDAWLPAVVVASALGYLAAWRAGARLSTIRRGRS